MTKRKADCAPEEWERIRAMDRANKKTPRAKERIRAYLREYSRSAKGRAKDKARYTEKRKDQITSWARKRKYGIDAADVAALMRIQQGRCGICLMPFATEGKAKRFQHVDHCHAERRVRGLLCARCNATEGLIRSLGITPAEFAMRMQAYLDAPPADQLLAT